MDINKEIISFVRNAGFKIGELTTQILALSGDEDEERIELTNLRQHLILYSKILLPSEYDFYDDSINLLTWSSHDIIDEIHFLTAEARLSRVPYTNIDREIIELIVRTEKITNNGLVDLGDLPVGTENDIWMFDNQGNIGLVNLNRYVGWFGEVPQQYFVPKKRIQTPTFLHSELVELNPLLRDGETVYIKEDENGRLVRKKVGPGFYNDIDFFEDDYFGEDLEVTNVLGDLPNNIKGLTVKETLTKIVAPYKDPVVTLAQNNALNGIFENEKVIEVGQSIAGPVLVNYQISNSKNLAEEDPIVVFANGKFSNEGTFPVTGQVSLSLGSPFIPTGLESLGITVSSINSDGETIPGATTTIKSVARIISGFSTNPNLDANQFLSISGRTDTVTDNPEGDFPFIGIGYRFIAVPVMLIDTDGLVFTDVTYPGRTSPIEMLPGSVLTINNGVGTYDYQVYRSKYLLLGSSSIRVTRGSAEITSPWEIASRIVPKWADGTILDSSAVAGGVYVVKNKEERNLISRFQRVLTNRYSTLTYVVSERTFYELINNPTTSVTQDSDWSPIVSNVDILQPLGTWDPTSNTPSLSDSIAPDFEGNFYFVDNAGTNFDFTDPNLFAGETTDLADGDWVISNGARWFRIKNRNVTWSNIFGIPSNVLLLAQGQVISHLHEISDINGLADALAGKLKTSDVASTTTDFALVPDSKIINLAFLKKYFYTKVEIQDLLNSKLGQGVNNIDGAIYEISGGRFLLDFFNARYDITDGAFELDFSNSGFTFVDNGFTVALIGKGFEVSTGGLFYEDIVGDYKRRLHIPDGGGTNEIRLELRDKTTNALVQSFILDENGPRLGTPYIGNNPQDLPTRDWIQQQLAAIGSGTGQGLHVPVQNIILLKALDTTDAELYPDKWLINVENFGLYRYDREGVGPEDLPQVVLPDTGPGSWIRISAQINSHELLSLLQGGAPGEYFHLTFAEHALVQGLQALLDGKVNRIVSEDLYSMEPDSAGGRSMSIGTPSVPFSQIFLNATQLFRVLIGNGALTISNVLSELANSTNGVKSLTVEPTGIFVKDLAFGRGLTGGANFSANYQDLDYVQKIWVVQQLAAIGSGTGQGVHVGVQNESELKALNTTNATNYPDKWLIHVEDLGLYRFDREGVASEDSPRVISPTTGPGRWIRISTPLTDHALLDFLQGGTTGEYYHLTAAQHAIAVATELAFTIAYASKIDTRPEQVDVAPSSAFNAVLGKTQKWTLTSDVTVTSFSNLSFNRETIIDKRGPFKLIISGALTRVAGYPKTEDQEIIIRQIDSGVIRVAYLDSSLFLGVFANLPALQSAYPTAPIDGAYAHVDPGAGTPLIRYSYDTDEGWVESGTTSSGELVDDTSPQLGGNLDKNGRMIGQTKFNDSLGTANETVSFANGTYHRLDLTAAAASTDLTLQGAIEGAKMLLEVVTATGKALTWSNVEWPGGTAPVITNSDNKLDRFEIEFDGSTYYGSVKGQNYTRPFSLNELFEHRWNHENGLQQDGSTPAAVGDAVYTFVDLIGSINIPWVGVGIPPSRNAGGYIEIGTGVDIHWETAILGTPISGDFESWYVLDNVAGEDFDFFFSSTTDVTIQGAGGSNLSINAGTTATFTGAKPADGARTILRIRREGTTTNGSIFINNVANLDNPLTIGNDNLSRFSIGSSSQNAAWRFKERLVINRLLTTQEATDTYNALSALYP